MDICSVNIAAAGHSVPAWHNIKGDERLVLLVCHGFCSEKHSGTPHLLAEALADLGIAVLAMDFPGHGEHPLDGDGLTVANCLADVKAAEAYIQQLAPLAEIGYFGSSFGGYILLLFAALCQPVGSRLMLRSGAVDMPQIFRADTTEQQWAELEAQGWYELGWDRKLRIYPPLYDDFDAHDAFISYQPGMMRLMMVHGTEDAEVPYASAQRFAAEKGALLITVEGGGHRLERDGDKALLIAAARALFA